ncbi:hypothetical protein AFLA70_46g003231 [Aspergillus flavus AF70]|nr:hypothetical protein AFLA70_46g003231 [Aspergillus flavus AF70]
MTPAEVSWVSVGRWYNSGNGYLSDVELVISTAPNDSSRVTVVTVSCHSLVPKVVLVKACLSWLSTP